MALPNDKRSLQDRMSRVATRMAQKFGNGLFNGVTAGAGATAGIPVSVLINRIAGKKVSLDSLGRENASALSFTVIDTANGATAATQDQLVAATYTQSFLPTGIYGSSTALAMLAKLKARVDSVDFHVVGDSNAASPSGANGWAFGLHRGLIRGCCAPVYGTGLFNVSIHQSANSLASITDPTKKIGAVASEGYRYINGYLFDGATSDGSTPFPNSGASAQSGNLYAPSDIKVFFDIKPSSGSFRSTAGYTADFAWFPPSGLTFYRGEAPTATSLSDWKGVFDTDGIDTRGALTYRVVHSLHPNSTGSFPLILYGISTGGGAAYNTSFGISFPPGDISNPTTYSQMGKRIAVSGATGTTASFQTWAADSTRVGVTIGFNWYGLGQAYGGTTYAKGPFAIFLESIHGNTLGFAVTLAQTWGGATSTSVGNIIEAVSTANDSNGNCLLRTLVKETRERQIQAGGSGNLIVFVNSGLNETGNDGSGEVAGAAAYKAAVQKIVSSYKTVWDRLGYPENDLAFIVTVTHPTFLSPAQEPVTGLYDWNLDSIRTRGVEYSQTLPDYSVVSPYSNVTFVNLTQLGSDGITQGGLTAGNSYSGNASFYYINLPIGDDKGSHLITGFTGGYSYLAELLVKRCLRYSA